jgi:hypothetical protein
MKLFELVSTEKSILDADMNEMANLYPKETGLQVVCWFGEVGGQHGPRLKVSNTPGKFNKNSNFVISVAKNPIVLTPKAALVSSSKIEDVIDWIKLNYDDLMELWKIHESGDGEAQIILNRLKKI